MKKSKVSGKAECQGIEISPETRFHLINDAAYFREIQQSRDGVGMVNAASAWCEVEAEIDALIRKHAHRPGRPSGAAGWIRGGRAAYYLRCQIIV